MSKKVTITKLDPSYEVARMSISDEYPDPLYFDKDGRRIPMIEVEEDYKPSYDTEQSKLKGFWNRHEVDVYRDVRVRVCTFKSRWLLTANLKLLAICLFDKYVGRHFGMGKMTTKDDF